MRQLTEALHRQFPEAAEVPAIVAINLACGRCDRLFEVGK